MSETKRSTLKHVPRKDAPGVAVPYVDPPPRTASDQEEDVAFVDTSSVPLLLATAMLLEAMPRRAQTLIGQPNAVAVVVEVAHPDMIDPVAHSLRIKGAFAEVYKRSGANRSSDRDRGCDTVASLLGAGANICGISQAPERYLPATLVAAADVRVRLGAPSVAAIRCVIGLVTRRRVPRLAPEAVLGLSFLEVCAAIRRNGTAGACVRRLGAMAASRRGAVQPSDGPRLEEMHGLGPFRDWGLGLVAAVGAWRRGGPWALPHRAAVLGGPPGTGKTSAVVALARSLELPLYATSAAAWFATTNGYLGDVIKAINTAFNEASVNGPAVFFIDELDAIPSREGLDSRHRDFWVPVITALLLELDSATSNSANLIVVAATNYPDRLDPALVRPGRLDQVLRIGLPDADAIVGILRQHLGDALPDADLTPLGILGAGATGADIAGWAKAARGAARLAGRDVEWDDVVRQVCPPETRPPEEVRTIARHEASHAVVHVLLGGTLDVVSLVERGGYAGRTKVHHAHVHMMGAADVDCVVATMLAGRAADETWGHAVAGAGGASYSDLAVATRMVAAKLGSWGLGDNLLHRGDWSDMQELLREPAFRASVSRELDRIYDRTRHIVRENAALIDRVAQRLVESRVLSDADVRQLVGASRHATRKPRPAEGGLHA